MGNAGRMNVRESALKQGGALTAVRTDTTRVDGRVNAANGGWSQNYQQKPFNVGAPRHLFQRQHCGSIMMPGEASNDCTVICGS